MYFTVPPNGVAKLHFGAHFKLPNQTAGTVDVYGLQILDATLETGNTVIENPATGLLKERLPWVDVVRNSVQEADAAVDQHALEAEAKPVQARQPLRGVAGRQAPPGRAAGAAADGGAVREGQPIARAALQRSCRAARGDCARGHGGACGAAEHSGLGFLWKMHIFPCFCMFFWRCH